MDIIEEKRKTMKISTKGKYALEIVADLALHSDSEHPESLKNIALRRGLSEKYLERIIKALKVSGIVRSERGACGGYCLALPVGDLTAYDVLKASEGELAPVECLTKDTDCGIDCAKCPTQEVWRSMWEVIKEVSAGVTIEDIIQAAEQDKNVLTSS